MPENTPISLLVHDGELLDLSELLGALGTPFVERRGALESEDCAVAWSLIIGTPQRMLGLPFQALGGGATHIAICDQDSRTLRNSLRRAGIELMVRRPVHPAALRALLLHALYRGPEKRRSTRVSIGAPIRFRAKLRQRSAILADLSIGGCRLITNHTPGRNRRITLSFPSELSDGKVFTIRGRVLRVAPAETEIGGSHVVIATFEETRAGAIRQLRAVIRAHATGPAVLECAIAPRPGTNTAQPAPAQSTDTQALAAEERGNGDLAGPELDERRGAARHIIDKRVIALGDEATRVLMGRDISIGGMRVDPNPLLVIGASLRLAIHVHGLEVPLVVTAEVQRVDEEAAALRFVELSSDARRFLSTTVGQLPVLEPGQDDVETGYIVSQILEDSSP
jgi:PilZ domain